MDAAQERSANRLASEKSPYLLQHAGNPVDWYPWCDEAFEKARAEGIDVPAAYVETARAMAEAHG